MTECDLPELLSRLTHAIRDGEYRSVALEAFARQVEKWPNYTVSQWVSWCCKAAWRAKTLHYRRVSRWGERSKGRRRRLPSYSFHRGGKEVSTAVDSLSPLRRLEIKEETTQL